MDSFDDLIKAADGGVYLAKNAGRGCVRVLQPAGASKSLE
jgi:PleD family two-component response regulator